MKPEQAWQDLLDKDDRTSPEEAPEMCLITFEELRGFMATTPDMDAALSDAWKALSWIINYDSEDRVLARCIKKIEAVREQAGTFDYKAMREKTERDRSAGYG